jgi:hypothetical protein
MRLLRLTCPFCDPLPTQRLRLSGLALWTLLLLLLAAPRAQGQAAPAFAGAARASTPAAQPIRPAAQAARKPGGGTHEGIKVHGHWTIEVRKPDGKLISHTEFENSLVGSGGGAVLPTFLAQNATQYTSNPTGLVSYTPGEWGILLGDATSPPCSANIANFPFNSSNPSNPVGVILAYPGPWCVLTQLAPPAAIYPENCGSATNQGCSYNLALQLNGGGLMLTGTVVSQTGGTTISQVQTLLSTCSDNVAPSRCWAETSPDAPVGGAGGDFVLAFTAAPLPPSNSTSTPCGGTGQISCAVSVPEAGDTINVSVIISFQ